MKRKVFNFSMISLLLIVLYSVFSRGVIVRYERTTGPELIVITGKRGLRSKGVNFNVNYYERVYTSYPLDTPYGNKAIGTAFAFYRIIDSKPTEDLNQRAPVLKITTFYPILAVVFFTFIILFTSIFILGKLSKLLFG